jgi:hypothetical protein
MEILYQHTLTNVDGLQIRVSFFKRDARSPMEVQNNAEIRYEHVYHTEVYDEPTETWIIAREEILEYLQFDRQE